MNLSFAGCGFLGIYHVGVSVCFKKYAPHLLLDKIGGASAGALSACCLLCDLPLGFFGVCAILKVGYLFKDVREAFGQFSAMESEGFAKYHYGITIVIIFVFLYLPSNPYGRNS